MSLEAQNNQRIAKNTVYLYIRMLVIMLIGLYTSRVVLDVLGVSDFGVYTVMGGIMGMLMYINNMLSGATSRFLTIDLGREDLVGLKQTFAMANTLSFIACAIILVLGETIGLWFMNTQLNIDPARMEAANWVYQCALASCVLSVIQLPFTSSIIAHEKMGIYAYMSMIDVIMKLIIVYMLTWCSFDKLKLYAILMFVVSLINTAIYFLICRRKFEECRFTFGFEKIKFKEMMSYSGWNMAGGFAAILNNYGLNILLNIFFGTLVNAARGIAQQVNNIVAQFYSSFETASRPQILKYYAQGNIEGMSKLICNTSKYGSYLLLCVIMPIAFNIDDFLMIWLGQNPEYTSWFVRVMLLQVLFQSIDLPVGMGIHAVGRMRLPNITSAILYLSVFPISWVAFKLGASPIMGYCIYLMFTPIILVVDLLILHKYCGFKIANFVRTVLCPFSIIAIICGISSYFIKQIDIFTGLTAFAVNCALVLIATMLIVFSFGLSKEMKRTILVKAKLAR